MVGNRSPVAEGIHSLTTCFTSLPPVPARYITTAPHFSKPLARNRRSGAQYLIKYVINCIIDHEVGSSSARLLVCRVVGVRRLRFEDGNEGCGP